MFIGFLQQLVGPLSYSVKIGVHAVTVAAITATNVFGLKMVSSSNMIFTALTLVPFLALVALAFSQKIMSWPVLMVKEWDAPFDWAALATTAIWSCGGWTNGGQIAGEIHRPGKSFLRAVIIVMILTLAFSLFPLAVAICDKPDLAHWKKFEVGYWVTVADDIGGQWLKSWMAIGGMICALGEMNSAICSQARLLQYLSFVVEFFPGWFSPMHPTFKTPYIAVITLGFVCFLVSLTPFQLIMDLVVSLASISLLITYASLIFLRYKDPFMHSNVARPFKIPFGNFGVGLICTLGSSVCIFNLLVAPLMAQVGGIVLVIFGLVLYYGARKLRKRKQKEDTGVTAIN